MKKQLLSTTAACLSLLGSTSLFAGNETPGHTRGCGTMQYLEMQKQKDPGLAARMAQIEFDMQAWINSNNKNPKPHVVVKIPTVVHVVYQTSAQNLADTYIQQQIDVLNKDFRKLNSDWSTTPSVFQSLVADCEIEFCLATKDPSGATTNGIVRKTTTDASFSTDDQIKYTAQGGSDAWTSSQYLNLWVGNLGGGLLGYAQFPGGGAATDGVVVLYSSLPGPPSAAPYDLGRTATHEVGHWLNLRHIWGDANCGNDQVTDTPTQQTSNFGCPTFPHVTCSNGPNGDMFMNYMDYTDDACMVMFSSGQKTRMQACLSSSRSGLGPASATKCTGGNPGIYDVSLNASTSLYPNPSTGEFFLDMKDAHFSNAKLTVYNAVGDAVLEKRIVISGDKSSIDLSDKPEGMYLIKVETPEGIITKKVTISR